MLLREFSALFVFYFRKPGFYCFLCFTAISNTAYPFILFLDHNFSNINFQWPHYVYEWFYFSWTTTLKNQSYLTLCVCVCACASMHTYDTAHRWRPRTTLESVLSSQMGFKDQTQVVRLGSKGLYQLSISQPQLIICLALSNSTQTVSVVQIFQDIHTLLSSWKDLSKSPHLLHLKRLFSRIPGQVLPWDPSSKGDSPPLLSGLLSVLDPVFLFDFLLLCGTCNFQ